MLPLAHALRDAGHEVTWATAAAACERVRREGFDADVAGPAELPNMELPPEVAALPPAERPDFMFALRFGRMRAGPMLTDLLPIVRSRRPDLLVCDQAELAGPIAAAVAGVPNVTHAFGRLLPEPRVARAENEMAPIWREHGLEPRPYAGTYDHLYIDIYPPSLQAGATSHVGQRQLIRPAKVLEPVVTDQPLVYITFGTVFNDDLGLFQTAVEAARELPVRVVVTLGPGHEPGVLGAQPSNVEVATFIPQEELLPECAAVVSHAGSGTFLAALAAGVPQVLLAREADQFLNAQAGAKGGVGLFVPPDEVSVESVRDALEQVLADADMRGRVKAVSAEIAAMPAPADVAEQLGRRFG